MTGSLSEGAEPESRIPAEYQGDVHAAPTTDLEHPSEVAGDEEGDTHQRSARTISARALRRQRRAISGW